LGDDKKAIADYDLALRLDPSKIGAFHNRGISRLSIHDYAGSVADLTRFIEKIPTEPKSYVSRGKAFAFLGNRDRALTDLNKALELDSKLSEAYLVRGTVYFMNDNAAALNDISKAIELDPKSIRAYFSRAFIKQFIKDYDGAVEDLTKAIELDPENVLLYHLRATTYRLLGKSDLATADDKIAARLEKNKPTPSPIDLPLTILPKTN